MNICDAICLGVAGFGSYFLYKHLFTNETTILWLNNCGDTVVIKGDTYTFNFDPPKKFTKLEIKSYYLNRFNSIHCDNEILRIKNTDGISEYCVETLPATITHTLRKGIIINTIQKCLLIKNYDAMKQLTYSDDIDKCYVCLNETQYKTKCKHHICIDCFKKVNYNNLYNCGICRCSIKI